MMNNALTVKDNIDIMKLPLKEREKYVREKYAWEHPKSKSVVILLTLFFGGLGAHNFYLGRWVRGTVELILSSTWIIWFVSGAAIMGNGGLVYEFLGMFVMISCILYPIYLLLEGFTAKRDVYGVPLR